MAFTKLWHHIITSSIWNADDKTRIVWITMLALANPDGFVRSSRTSLAVMARVSPEDCSKALAVLTAPDEESRTKTADGRRLEEVDGGWQIINYALYRNATSDDPHAVANRERQSRFRNKSSNSNVTSRDTASASSSVSSSEGKGMQGEGCSPTGTGLLLQLRHTGKFPALTAELLALKLRNYPKADVPVGHAELIEAAKSMPGAICSPAAWIDKTLQGIEARLVGAGVVAGPRRPMSAIERMGETRKEREARLRKEAGE